MKKLVMSMFSLLAISLPLTGNAVTEIISSSGLFGKASLPIQDICIAGSVTLRVDENSSRTQVITTANHVASASVSYVLQDSCLGILYVADGFSTSGISFKKTGNSISAAGFVPLEVREFNLNNGDFGFSSITINLSNIVFTKNSDIVSNVKETKSKEDKIGASIVKSSIVDESTSSSASVTGTFTSPIDGFSLIELSNSINVEMGTAKKHSVTITK